MPEPKRCRNCGHTHPPEARHIWGEPPPPGDSRVREGSSPALPSRPAAKPVDPAKVALAAMTAERDAWKARALKAEAIAADILAADERRRVKARTKEKLAKRRQRERAIARKTEEQAHGPGPAAPE